MPAKRAKRNRSAEQVEVDRAVKRAGELGRHYMGLLHKHIEGSQLASALDVPEADGHLLAQLTPATRDRLRIDGLLVEISSHLIRKGLATVR